MNAHAPNIDVSVHKSLQAGARRFQLKVDFRTDAKRLVILGPSGAGKSLLLQAIAGLIRPDAGHVRLGGSTLFDAAAGINLPVRRRRLGYMFQNYALFPHLDVRQNVAFGLSAGALNPSRRARDANVEEWLARFGLEAMAHQFPDQLSGGQSQRVALARALVGEPQALLLDEPFAALDPGLRQALRHSLDELQQRLGIPMLLITHDPEDAAAFGGACLSLEAGQMVGPL